jgi:hypothetical protein
MSVQSVCCVAINFTDSGRTEHTLRVYDALSGKKQHLPAVRDIQVNTVPCHTLCLLCIHSVYSVFADPSLLHYDLLQQAINESNLLHRLQRCVMNLTPNMLAPNFQPSKLQMMGRELTEEEKSVMKLWRIRRLLREQNGLPVETSLDRQQPPTKRQRTPLPEFSPRKYPSPTPSECDPEGDTYGSQQYSPTQAKSASQDEDDYEEMGDDTS